MLNDRSKEKNEIVTNSDVVSNKKLRWGVKRRAGDEVPELGKQNKQVLEDNGGICLGNRDSKKIYLTFDQGYEAGYTSQILEILKNNDVKVAFFITAHYTNSAPELVEQMIKEGHIIGNHTVNHESMPELSNEKIRTEVMDLHQVINDKFGYEMKYIRPPKGEYSQRTLKMTNSYGYKTVLWSFAYEDWNEKKQPDESFAKEKIMNCLHSGEIILLHGNSKTNVNILDEIIKEIKEKGYEFKSLDEFE